MRDPWTDLGGGLRVRQSVAYRMNSVLLLDREHTLLVDPGVLPSEIDDIARAVNDTAPRTITLLFTHAHWDHVLARPWWPRASTLAHDRFFAEVTRDAARIAAEAETLASRHGETWRHGFMPFAPEHAVSGLHFRKLGDWKVVVRDAPGHSRSQVTFHLPDRATLIAADMLSDIEIPLLDGPCAPYRRTLSDLLTLGTGGAIGTLIPGHGSIAQGQDAVLERLRRDLEYLERLEAGVQAARRANLTREQAAGKLADMTYGGAPIAEGVRADHVKNVGFAYDGLAAGRHDRMPSRGGRPRRAHRRP